MRKFCVLSFAVCLVLGARSPARADSATDARAVIEKAVKAQGGEEKLAKFKGVQEKLKGKFYGMGEGMEFTGETAIQLPDATRLQVDFDFSGMKFTFVQVFKGDKGWIELMGNTDDMSKEQVEEARHGMYTHRVSELVSLLKDKSFGLSLIGDVKVENKPAVGVKVSSKGQRDVNLYFDKDKGMLVKSEWKAKDPMQGDQEFTAASYYSGYKEVQGVMQPMKVKMMRDDKLYIETEVTEIKLVEKVDDSVFAKP